MRGMTCMYEPDTFQRNFMLMIEGGVISKSEEAMASVGKFMKNLKDDAQFFKDFKNIKLESVQRKAKDERDIVDFKIALYFQ